jgi:predicted transcriptional regulator
MEDSYITSLKHSLWHILAGMRGGMTRIRILELLRERPYNANQIRESLDLDYKTVLHHIKVLTEARAITHDDGKKYGLMYFLSPVLEENMGILDDIVGRIGEKKLKGKGKKSMGD